MMCSEGGYRIVEDEVTGIDNGGTGCAGDSREEGCRVQLH